MSLNAIFSRAAFAALAATGLLAWGGARGQGKIEPAQKTTVHTGIQQTPWFSAPEVRQNFKISDDQFNRLNKAYQESWTRYHTGINQLDKTLTDEQRQQRSRDLEKSFYKDFSTASDAILTDPEQRQRYHQLYWQFRGYGAFDDPMITEKLKLTPEQQQKLGKFNQEWSKQMGELTPTYQKDREEATKRFTKMQGEIGNRVNSVLTPDQQKVWRQMIGDPYTFQPSAYFQATATPDIKK